jgi:hypothetical protein
MYVKDWIDRRALVVFAWKVLIVAIAVIAILLVAVTARAQEAEPKQLSDDTKIELTNEIKIPELNLLRIQNLNFRFQLLVTQRTQIEQELQKIQVEVFAELENTRKSLNADSNTWNVDLVKGVFTRKPEEKKE